MTEEVAVSFLPTPLIWKQETTHINVNDSPHNV